MTDFRLCTRDVFGNVGYIVRKNGCISYMGADRTPWALSNLAGNSAAELCFQLEDASDAADACDAVRRRARIPWRALGEQPRAQP